MIKKNKRIILAITGASGAIYGKRFFDYLTANTDISIGLIISKVGEVVLKSELGLDKSYFEKERVVVYDNNNLNSNIASGSSKVNAMVVMPASMNSLSRIANGLAYDLIARSADVILKERKRIVLVARESPYNEIHLQNMLNLTKMGAVIVPASPGFYHKPETIDDLVDFVCAKVLNLLEIDNNLLTEWEPE